MWLLSTLLARPESDMVVIDLQHVVFLNQIFIPRNAIGRCLRIVSLASLTVKTSSSRRWHLPTGFVVIYPKGLEQL